MTLHVFANGEVLPAALLNALSLQTLISVADAAERDGTDFGDALTSVTVYRKDTRRCERFYPSILDNPRGARTSGWYPVDNLPYIDMFTDVGDFLSGVRYTIGSGLSEPYLYFQQRSDLEEWFPGIAGALKVKLEGVYRITYRTSWNRSSSAGTRQAFVLLNGAEIPGTRTLIDASIDSAGHSTIVVEVALDGVTDKLDFQMGQDSGVTIGGRAYATVEWVRPIQYT